jgi:hypothetical protein
MRYHPEGQALVPVVLAALLGVLQGAAVVCKPLSPAGARCGPFTHNSSRNGLTRACARSCRGRRRQVRGLRLSWARSPRVAAVKEDMAAEFGELIQAEHATMRQRHLARPWHRQGDPPAAACDDSPLLIARRRREGLSRHPSWEQAAVPPQPVFRRTSSRGADQGKGLINIRAGSSTRGPMPLGQK